MFDVHKIGPELEKLWNEGKTEVHHVLGMVLPHAIALAEDAQKVAESPIAPYIERLLGLPAATQGAVTGALDKLLEEFERLESQETAAASQPADPPSVQVQQG